MNATYLIYDVVILAVLAIFAWRGASKGLLLTLCGLVATLVALVGAFYVANIVTPLVTDMIEEQVTTAVEQQLSDYFEEHELPSVSDLSSSEVLTILSDLGFEDVTLELEDDNLVADSLTELATQVALSVSSSVAYCTIFLVAFILLLVLWAVVSHALNLVTYLPVIHSLNGLGGFILGLLKGCFVLFAAVFVLKYLGNSLPLDVVAGTTVLQFFYVSNPVDLLTMGSAYLRW